MPSLARFLESALAPVQGPHPSFESTHVLLALLLIGDAGMMGRLALSRESGLGEGPARTIVRRLRERGYVDTNASGCHLTGPGKKLYLEARQALSGFTTISGSHLTLGDSQVALVVRGREDTMKSGIEQRDSAIRVGAMGATTYSFRMNKFRIAGGSNDCERDFPDQAWSILRKELRPKNGDAVVLCGARDPTTARLGALSAAATLL